MNTASHAKIHPSPQPHQSGFALLLTLLVLALAAVILSLTARRTTASVRDAMQAERDLRHKYTLAAGDILLERAETLLIVQTPGDASAAATTADPNGRPLANRQFDLTLSGERVVILLASEQAKPNVNGLFSRLAAVDIGTQLEALGAKDPRPTVDPDRPFWCLEQLRPGATPNDLLGGLWPESLRTTTTGVAMTATLWGDGKLDWRTASPAALAAVLGPEVAPDKAAALVGAQSAATTDGALDQATARWTSKEKQVLNARTTIKPQAWSVWVAAGPVQADAAPACYRLTTLTKLNDHPSWHRQEWNPAP